MDWFTETFHIATDAETSQCQIIIKDSVRISVLTSRLIRIEKQPDGKFCNLPTQTVLNRNLDKTPFIVTDNKSNFAVKTDDVSFIFDADCNLIGADMKNGMRCSDFHKGNLKGTRRTLDMTSGAVSLEDGILSKDGAAIIDDSETLIIMDDGTVKPRGEILGRTENGTDIYCFAYAHDYEDAVRDFYRLTGSTPLIPRFAFGNWWSRYKAYTQEEYLTLMRRFIKEEIPITVATIDMDWHWTDVVKRFGPEAKNDYVPKNPIRWITGCFINSGWTGYTWNSDLFPDYLTFLKTLKEENFRITVNLHPAMGVKFFECMYKEFAEFMGIDPDSHKRIEFDFTDKKFIEGYFKFIHHKYEDEGVDFWWMDWQQGNETKIKGLDPLWALNHYHSLDIARDGKKRPLILSRYAGAGSHRYPLGFSGDTGVTWKTLDFQPYFTATASNIGYSWWSHDIGGHHNGTRDDDLYIRWLQFGTFSPIMRLHSTSNEFLGKEPWKFSAEANEAATKTLRFRHRLIAYIYTMNRRTEHDGIPMIEPMYYRYPECDDAYNVKNEYFFGSELIVSPITSPLSRQTLMGSTDVWLPEGRFTDIFTGRIYKGGKKFKMFRDSSSIPVLAKTGAIIPLGTDDRTNDISNPENMEIMIYRGNGRFKLYEDDGETMNYKKGQFAETLYISEEKNGNEIFTVMPAEGDLTVIPSIRNYKLSFRDISSSQNITVTIDGKRKAFTFTEENGETTVNISASPQNKIKVTIKNMVPKQNPPRKELLTELFSKVQGSNNAKVIKYTYCLRDGFNGKIPGNTELQSAVDEIFNIIK